MQKTVEEIPSREVKEEYFKKLEQWVRRAQILQNAQACFPYYLASNYPNYFTVNADGSTSNTTTKPSTTSTSAVPGSGSSATPTPTTTNADRSRLSGNQSTSQQDEGYEYIIAPLWKRFVAEMIDVSMLLLLKVALTFLVLNTLDLDLSYEFDSINENDTKFLSMADLVSISSDLVALEILMKVVVCLYEAVWTMNGRVITGGATPGKLLLRLRIVYVETLTVRMDEQDLNGNGPIRAVIYPATNPGFRRAFFRAIAKNWVLALLFPVCFVFLFLKNNRTFYDVMTKTVVVEENPTPERRNR